MSMIGNFRAVSDDDIKALLERPSRVVKLLYDEDPAERRPILGGLFRGPRRETRDDWHPSSAGEELDVDKAWQGIHFLLTGTAWEGDPPLNFINSGTAGTWVGDVDVGYGPARAFDSGEVRAIAEELDKLPPASLRSRFDPQTMMDEGVYPEIWDRDPAEDDTLGYLLEYYDDLRSFVRRTADRGDGMLVYLN
jgi:hypothetical protein